MEPITASGSYNIIMGTAKTLNSMSGISKWSSIKWDEQEQAFICKNATSLFALPQGEAAIKKQISEVYQRFNSNLQTVMESKNDNPHMIKLINAALIDIERNVASSKEQLSTSEGIYQNTILACIDDILSDLAEAKKILNESSKSPNADENSASISSEESSSDDGTVQEKIKFTIEAPPDRPSTASPLPSSKSTQNYAAVMDMVKEGKLTEAYRLSVYGNLHDTEKNEIYPILIGDILQQMNASNKEETLDILTDIVHDIPDQNISSILQTGIEEKISMLEKKQRETSQQVEAFLREGKYNEAFELAEEGKITKEEVHDIVNLIAREPSSPSNSEENFSIDHLFEQAKKNLGTNETQSPSSDKG